MKPLILIAAILVTTSSATLHGAISTQYHTQDHHGQYSYGYHGPLSSASESKSHDGVTKGSYSYVDGYGHVQSVHYTADPHTGFHAVGTNLPQAPHPVNHGHLGLGHYGNPVPTNPHGVPVDTPEVA
uniref:Cuticle protein 6 n=1 Tax=Megaselia scalaris TaxID=36166 RepID=T1GUC1_MEGSC